MTSLRPWLLGPAVIILTALVFASARPGAFHFDDFHAIVNNPTLAFATPSQIFAYPQLFSGESIPMYRPLTVLSLALQACGNELSPSAMITVNIALHALAAGLVFALALALSRSPAAALIAALIFALHPVQTQAVNYISCRASLLAGCLALAALLLVALAGRAGPKGRAALQILAAAVFGLSLLAKSEAFGLCLMPLIMGLALGHDQQGPRKYLLPALAFLAAAIAYLVLRKLMAVTVMVPDDPVRPIIPNLATGARAVSLYLALILNPTRLSVIHDLDPSASILDPRAAPAAIIVIIAAALAFRHRRERPLIIIGLAWFLLGLAPTTTLVPLRNPAAEHHLYLAMPGLALAAAEALKTHTAKKTVLAALAAVLLCWITLDVTRNRVWQNETTLWEAAAERAPASAPVWVNLGVEWYGRGETMKARRAFERALTLDPERPEARANLGRIYLDLGYTAEGVALLELALGTGAEAPALHYNLARGYAVQGLHRAAEVHYLKAMAQDPGYALACEGLAGLYIYQIQDPARARDTLAKCLAMNPAPEQIARIRSLLTVIETRFPE